MKNWERAYDRWLEEPYQREEEEFEEDESEWDEPEYDIFWLDD